MSHPIRARRNGFTTVCTDGTREFTVKAESAFEARRFVERFNWIANVNPGWTLSEVLYDAVTGHAAAHRAQARRRFGSCFARQRPEPSAA